MKSLRDYINLFEATERETSSKRRTTVDVDDAPNIDLDIELDTPASKGELSNVNRDSKDLEQTKLNMKTRDVAKVKPMSATNAMKAASHLADLDNAGLSDPEDDNDYTVEIKPDTKNLPSVVSKQLSTQGYEIDIEWTPVKKLPGYMKSAIRQLGKLVFDQFTDVPIDEIQTVTTLTNDEYEVKQLFAWIRANGIKDDTANIDFSKIMPGYEAQTQLWRTEEYTFLLVKDFAGMYVYGMEGGRGVSLDNKKHKRLK